MFVIFYTFLPLFAYQLGANALEIGLVGGTNYAIYSFMPFVLGRFSNKLLIRSFFIASSFALLTIVSLAYSLANSPTVIIIARVFEGVSWTLLWPGLQVGFALDTRMNAKKALSYYNITWSAGATIGPLVGAGLVSLFSYRITFQVTALMLVLVTIVNSVSFLYARRIASSEKTLEGSRLESSLRTEVIRDNNSDNPRQSALPSGQHNLNIVFYLSVTTIVTLTTTIILTFFPPYADSIGISVILIGTTSFVFGIARFLVYFLTTTDKIRSYLFDKQFRNLKLILSLGFLAIACSVFLVAHGNITIYLIAAAALGSLYATINGITQAGIVAEAPSSKTGTASGAFESAVGIGSTVGPIASGLVSSGSLLTAFYVPIIGILSVISIFAILFTMHYFRKKT